MRVRFLGTAGYHDGEERKTSCVLVPEEGIVLDAGSGFYRIGRYKETEELNVLLSHGHKDHISGLTDCLIAFFGDSENQYQVKLNVYGSPRAIRTVRDVLFHPDYFPINPEKLPFEFNLHEISNSEFSIGEVDVKVAKFPHNRCNVRAYRLEKDDKVLCYVTDTYPSSEVAEFVKGADFLIEDCYFTNSFKEFAKKTIHGYSGGVAEVAKLAGVKALALTHLHPLLDELEYYLEMPSKEDESKLLREVRDIFPNAFIAHDLVESRF